MNTQVVVQNICFIRADPDRPIYYYCAAAPGISVIDGNQPAVQLQIFRNSSQPATVYYAMLSLQTQLTSSPEAAQEAAAGSPDIPRDAVLLPLQAIACSATLDIPGFIAGQTSKTSLSEQQNCYLLAKLPPDADIALLASLMNAPASTPIAISYKIDYLQQLPPATFELEARWDQVYQFLQESVGFNLLIFSVDIEETSSRLISEKVVTVKVRDTDPDGHFKQAAAELTQILISEFFTPVFAEVPQQSKPKAGFYLQRLSIEDIDQRRLSGKLTETTVVKRSLYPQALFAELVAGTDYQADRVISQHDLQDDFFAYREVRISLLSDELDDNIQLVMARFRYGSKSEQFTFREGDTKSKRFRSPSITDPKTGKMLWPVEYDFTVYLNQAVGGIRSVSSGALQTELNDVYLDIESLYGRYDFVIKTASLFDWRWYQSVLVTLRCRHIGMPASSLSKSFQISQTAQQDSYPVMLPNPDQYLFDVTKEYSSAVNSPHISAELNEPTSQDVYLFSSLYHQRVLTLSASMDWQQVESVLVSASYAYLPGDETPPLQQIFQFTEIDATSQRFSADQIDPERLIVNLEIWFSYLPGQGGDKPEYVQTATDQDAIDIANLN
ncbi:hypothetical protein [Serratia plymuthica]|uniref:Uncharacterized protein n=1 Tax=Serratia plymuthica TaxID=82996 RepID=A0A2X4UYL6_SERPL|nr:hypothetical protein [Serratia plymuthica]QPS20903.1 hypothetical protein I6G64_00240 [Serratia plymuthica]QPS62515.1 hypothetical protein I6G52_21005 [Serratia plymuthica]RKS65181.1 hypothetical protein C8E17_4537 [Serratia plymuthica]CAI2431331.1 Uncharacterised protein [Serratia plymuthica]SQI39732.1 Uncharacterised protein [Serratia plymuthica]